MICSIISDMEITGEVAKRLRAEIEDLADTYTRVDFLVGDISGVERVAQEMISEIERTDYFTRLFMVSIEPKGPKGALIPDAVEMVKPEYVVAWRNRWMMQKSETAIICVEDGDILPESDIRIIDIRTAKACR